MDYRKLCQAWEANGIRARNPYKFDGVDKDYGERIHINDCGGVLDAEAPGWDSVSSRHSRKNAAGEEWDLGAGYDGMVEMIKGRDWEKARKAMQREAENVVPSYYTETPSLTAGPVGMRPNIPALVANDMDFMWGMQDQPVKPVISLIVNGGYYWGLDATHVVPWAVALLRWIDGAAVRGYSVALSVVYNAMRTENPEGEVYEMELVVKEPQETLQLGVIAAALHPATFRRLFFAWLESYGTEKMQEKRAHAVGFGYGYAGSRVQGKHPLELCVPSFDSELLKKTRSGKYRSTDRRLAHAPDNWDETLETLRTVLRPQLEEAGLAGLVADHA